MPSSAIGRAARAARDDLALFGWGNGSLYLVARAVERVTGGRCALIKYYFAAQPVPQSDAADARRPGKTRIYEALPGDPIVARFPRPREVIAMRYRNGARCVVAELSGDLVGFIWFQLSRYDEDEVRCLYLLEPAGEVAWEFDVYVEPKYRMSRAFLQLWQAVHERLRQAGCRWTIGRTSAFNAVSLASHRRLGPRHLGTGVFLRLGRVQVAFLSVAPYVACSVRDAGRPGVVLRAPASEAPL